MLTIYDWEKGESKPRAKALAGWAKIRGLGKREAWKRLELLGRQGCLDCLFPANVEAPGGPRSEAGQMSR